MIIVIDSRGLGEYVQLNPNLHTIDDFVEMLIEANFISVKIFERCEVGVSFTSSENLEITLQGVKADDEMFCGEMADRLAELINNPSDSSDEVVRPPVLQFAGAAVSAPAVFEESLNGAPTVTSVVSLLLVLCLSAMLTLYF